MAIHPVVWFLIGVGVGLLNAVLLVSTIRRLDPGLRVGSVGLVVVGYMLRYAATGVVLALAVRQGVKPGLAVALGMWLARWWGVHLGRSGGIDWARLGQEWR